MKSALPDHYATLGLHRNCTDAQIRAAYRLLAKQLHPDVNGGSHEAVAQTQALNAAYETLGDLVRRREYDQELAALPKAAGRNGKLTPNIAKEMHLRFDEFLRGSKLEIRVNDPGQPEGVEIYELIVPPETAPGTRFKVARDGGGCITVRVKARPDFRFKVRGSDLRCDLKIRSQRAQQGGVESMRGLMGNFLRVNIPPRTARGEIIRLPGEGLPKPRGGRGDLLVRILYTPEVQIRRTVRR
ncbi:MAG TPA: DnaJ domain-containing protein [Verrucomicrobiae bacterium]|nr:DnaJ domain-containing protein [Verrucomicrobiae bacterium]